MSIIISHSKTKRRIEGSFSICGNRHDLEAIANQILSECKEYCWSYGWVDIIIPPLPVLANQEPIAWDN